MHIHVNAAVNNCTDSKLCHRKAKFGQFSIKKEKKKDAEGNFHLAQHTSGIPSWFPDSHLAAQGCVGTTQHHCKMWGCLQKPQKVAVKLWFPVCTPSLEPRDTQGWRRSCSLQMQFEAAFKNFHVGVCQKSFFFPYFIFFPARETTDFYSYLHSPSESKWKSRPEELQSIKLAKSKCYFWKTSSRCSCQTPSTQSCSI